MKAIARRPNVATLRAAERAWIAGRAALVGGDLIEGAVWWRLTEDVHPRGVVLLEVWGGEKIDAWRTLEENRPADVTVVLMHRPAGRWQRLLRWTARTWWRLFLQPIRLRGAR